MPPRFIPRGQWTIPQEPIASSLTPVFDEQRFQTIHWPGHVDSDFAGKTQAQSDALMTSKLRAEQHMYLTDPDRGYSLGYQWAVQPDNINGFASVWEIRGFTFRCAAQGGDATGEAVVNNRQAMAIQLKTPNRAGATAAQVATVQWLVTECRKRAPQALTVNGHRDVKATACPDPFYPQVVAGVFDPRLAPPPEGFLMALDDAEQEDLYLRVKRLCVDLIPFYQDAQASDARFQIQTLMERFDCAKGAEVAALSSKVTPLLDDETGIKATLAEQHLAITQLINGIPQKVLDLVAAELPGVTLPPEFTTNLINGVRLEFARALAVDPVT